MSVWPLVLVPAWLDSPPPTLWMWCDDACRRLASRAHCTAPSWEPCVRSWLGRALYVDCTKGWAWTGSKGPSPWAWASPHLTSPTAFCSSCIRWTTSPTEAVGRAADAWRGAQFGLTWGRWSTLSNGNKGGVQRVDAGSSPARSCLLLDRMSREWIGNRMSHSISSFSTRTVGFRRHRESVEIKEKCLYNCRSHNYKSGMIKTRRIWRTLVCCVVLCCVDKILICTL